jgi:hypothetical protein
MFSWGGLGVNLPRPLLLRRGRQKARPADSGLANSLLEGQLPASSNPRDLTGAPAKRGDIRNFDIYDYVLNGADSPGPASGGT